MRFFLRLLSLVVFAASPLRAAVLVSENFEALTLNGTTLPAGWTKFDPDASGTFTVVAGHNGSGGSAGKGGRWSSGATSTPNSILGGFIQPPPQAIGTQGFTLTCDFQLVAGTTTGDDTVLVLGDLRDPYGQNAAEQNRFFMVVFNEGATSNEVFLVTEGVRTQLGTDFRTSGLTTGVWYRVQLTWTPSGGANGTLAFTLTRASNGANEGTFSQPATMPGAVSFGFGCYNDVGIFDHIVVDGAALVPTVTAGNDMVEVGVSGALAFDPTINDTANVGAIDRATLIVVTPPAFGTASIDPLTRQLVYRHSGAGAGADTLRYRVSSTAGANGEANVNISVSAAMRLANATLALPADPPALAGALQLVDAFPGLTFDGIVSLASVPGSPEKLLVASAHGASAGSDSKVWMIPDTAAAAPVKKELFEVDSLCPAPFTRGRGIYSVVCHPGFATNGHLIVCYQGTPDGFPIPASELPNLSKNGAPFSTINCTLRISRFTITPAQLTTLLTSSNATDLANARAAIVASELRYLNLAEQDLFHSINDCHFGADGYLYVTFGDEGDQGEPYRNAQHIVKDQFSSLIRIDVDRLPGNLEPNPHYAIVVNSGTGMANFKVPADNPFTGNSVTFNGVTYTPAHSDFGKIRTEMWAVGLRNPFKFHLDENGGVTEVWVGDVGMDLWEEVSVLRKADNAGWSYWEGSHATAIGHAIAPASHKAPEWDYAHAGGNNCVIGGVLYRGGAYAAPLAGKYIFGDHGSGRLWTLDPAVSGAGKVQDLGVGTISLVVDFHVDPLTGHILIAQYQAGKKIYRLKEAPPVNDGFPQLLSETGAFADLATLTPNPGIVPYEPNLKFWSDHADKGRWFAIKNTSDAMGYSRDGAWTFPVGQIFIKHFDMELNRSFPGTSRKRLETRFLVRNTGGIYGVSYRWNEAGTDAALVGIAGDDFDLTIREGGANNGGTVTGGTLLDQSWRIPSRGECLTCHNPTAGHALSPTTQQFNKAGQLGHAGGNFLDLLAQSGYLAGFNDNPAALSRFYRPDEIGANLDERVRSYLAVNCSYCHQPNSGIVESWDARGHLPIDAMRILYGVPVSETFHGPEDRLIIPGNKLDSVIWNRIQARNVVGNGTFNGFSQMPPLATHVTDPAGVALLSQWIDQFANVAPSVTAGTPSALNMTENAALGANVATVSTNDPDVRAGEPDNNFVTYAITGGNANGLFSINPVTGTLSINGVLDFETGAQHALTITATDNFAPNPKTTAHTITVQVQDIASEDANSNGIPDWWETPYALALTAGGDFDLDGVRDFFEFLGGSHPGLADTAAGLGLRITARTAQPVAGTFVRWRVRNGLFLNQHYFVRAAASPGGPWIVLQPADYEITSINPVSLGFSEIVIFVPGVGSASFFRLTNDAN